MRFKIDENLPAEIAGLLQLAGHDALTVIDQKLTGEDDARILAICKQEKRALVTLDLDFSDARSYRPHEYSGLVVLRLYKQDKPHVLATISRIIPIFEREQVERRLWIVEENRIRIRGEDF